VAVADLLFLFCFKAWWAVVHPVGSVVIMFVLRLEHSMYMC